MSKAQQILTELLNKIAAERALSKPRVDIQPISSNGANYTTDLFLVTISDRHTELQLFAKVAAIGKKFRDHLPIPLFEIENTFYNKLANVFKELQDKHNVPENKRFISPEFYGCSDKMYEEIIVLENLTAKGFTVHDRLKSVDWEYANKAVEEIAKFHALSFAFKQEQPEKFEKIVEDFRFDWSSPAGIDIWTQAIDFACDAVKIEYKIKLREFLERIDYEGFTNLYEPDRSVVFGHNEYRVSNQMYKIDQEGRIEFRIIDYQSVRAGPPVLDLLYFIFICTDKTFRAQYYEKLLDHYYTELSLAMKRLGLNPEENYSREDFEAEYKARLPFGLSVAVFMLPMVTLDPKDAPKVNKDSEVTLFTRIKPSALHAQLINGIVDDFIQWGVM